MKSISYKVHGRNVEIPNEYEHLIQMKRRDDFAEEFNIPKDDYFHVIEELEPHQIKYPESYLGISHSDEIIYVQINSQKLSKF